MASRDIEKGITEKTHLLLLASDKIDDWSSVSITIGTTVGFLWTAIDSYIEDNASKIAIVTVATYLTYQLAQRAKIKYCNGDTEEVNKNARDLSLKVMASMSGWMSGDYLGTALGWGPELTTLPIAFADAIAVSAANIINVIADDSTQRNAKEIAKDTVNLACTVAVAASIWQLVGTNIYGMADDIVDSIHPCAASVIKATISGLAIGAAFYGVYKAVPTIVSKFFSCRNNERTDDSDSEMDCADPAPSSFQGLGKAPLDS